MFAWLNGPGAAFRNPYPGDTNYLSAYGPDGSSRRPQKDNEDEYGNNEKNENENEEDGEEGESAEGGEESGASPAAEGRNGRKRSRGPVDQRLLRPFPLNATFKSQNVLGEKLREEVWRQVVELRQSVSTVSAVYNIDMRRVAAVVRLKQIEKDWIEKVSKKHIPVSTTTCGT